MYDMDSSNNGIVISNRIRLARNLKKYPFYRKITKEQSIDMIEEIKNAVFSNQNLLEEDLKYIDLDKLDRLDKVSMVEKHIMSPALLNSPKPKALILKQDETISIMLNEEDHIRIQTILPEDDIDKVYKLSNKIDDLIEENVEYAYNNDYGYLTSCPTNVGTGMRASYMLHIPLIELTEQIRQITQFISKFGLTIRGIYGEGSKSQGGIYQISNQITLGKSEEAIISNLKTVVNQIIGQEQRLRQKLISENYITLEDQVYRAYGLIKHAKIMTLEEAMRDLSYVRLGYEMSVLDESLPLSNIYNIMINIQPANLTKYSGKNLNKDEINVVRAEFIRKQFKIKEN